MATEKSRISSWSGASGTSLGAVVISSVLAMGTNQAKALASAWARAKVKTKAKARAKAKAKALANARVKARATVAAKVAAKMLAMGTNQAKTLDAAGSWMTSR